MRRSESAGMTPVRMVKELQGGFPDHETVQRRTDTQLAALLEGLQAMVKESVSESVQHAMSGIVQRPAMQERRENGFAFGGQAPSEEDQLSAADHKFLVEVSQATGLEWTLPPGAGPTAVTAAAQARFALPSPRGLPLAQQVHALKQHPGLAQELDRLALERHKAWLQRSQQQLPPPPQLPPSQQQLPPPPSEDVAVIGAAAAAAEETLAGEGTQGTDLSAMQEKRRRWCMQYQAQEQWSDSTRDAASELIAPEEAAAAVPSFGPSSAVAAAATTEGGQTVVVLGPPSADKESLCAALVARLGGVQHGTAAVLAAAAAEESAEGLQVAALMQSGKIVPTTLVQQLVVQAIRSNASSSDGATAHVLLGRTKLTLTPARNLNLCNPSLSPHPHGVPPDFP